jgi:hypothetical protein
MESTVRTLYTTTLETSGFYKYTAQVTLALGSSTGGDIHVGIGNGYEYSLLSYQYQTDYSQYGGCNTLHYSISGFTFIDPGSNLYLSVVNATGGSLTIDEIGAIVVTTITQPPINFLAFTEVPGGGTGTGYEM